MLYFSYNDFMDYSENGKIDEITKVNENIVKYEVLNVTDNEQENEEQIIQILKSKKELEKFLIEFFDMREIENINYCNIKKLNNRENIIVSKIKEKEIFILIKVIQDIDTNISYKMFEYSSNIIKEWKMKEDKLNKRYPIVIPIVIYVGNKIWNINNINFKKVNYITYEDNKINFSYNMIDINKLEIEKLNNMKSLISLKLIEIKNKYLQINKKSIDY